MEDGNMKRKAISVLLSAALIAATLAGLQKS